MALEIEFSAFRRRRAIIILGSVKVYEKTYVMEHITFHLIDVVKYGIVPAFYHNDLSPITYKAGAEDIALLCIEYNIKYTNEDLVLHLIEDMHKAYKKQ